MLSYWTVSGREFHSRWEFDDCGHLEEGELRMNRKTCALKDAFMTKAAVLVLFAFASGVLLADSITYVLQSDGSSNRAAFENAYYWADVETSKRGSESVEQKKPLDPAADYVVRSDYTCSSVNVDNGDIVFGGRSLTLGTETENGNFRLYLYGNANLVFNEPGLFLRRGTFWIDWGPVHRISGEMTVLPSATGGMVVRPSYRNTTLQLDSELHGDAGANLDIYCAKDKEPFRVNAANPNSNYAGKFTVYSDRGALYNGMPPVTLSLGTAQVGAVELKTHSALASCTCDGVVTVGSLTLHADSHLMVSNKTTIAADGVSVSENSRFVVEYSLVLPEEGVVHLHLPYLLKDPNSQSGRIPVLAAPAGSIDKSRFVLVSGTGAFAYPYSLDVKTENGVDTMYVVFEADGPTVVKVFTDNGGGTATIHDSGLTNAVRWSDGLVPHAGAHYLVEKVDGLAINLRTLYATSGSYTFPGLSLTLGEGCTLNTFVQNLAITNLVLLNGSVVAQGQWSANLHLLGPGIRMVSGKVYIEAHDTHTMYFDSPISGNAQIVIRGHKTSSSPQGNIRMEVANPDFGGSIHLTSWWTGTWNGIFAAPKNQTLTVATPASLGAPLAELNPQALMIDTYGEFIVPETMSFEDVTRGLWLGNNAQIRVPEGVVASFHAQRTMAGETFVRQSGTLALGGAVRFASANGIVDEPQARSNLLSFVEGGSLKALSAGCIDGVIVAFSNQTSRLVLDADSTDAELRACGVRNVKTDTPFVFADGDLKVEFDLSGDVPLESGEVHRLGIMTVTSAAAAKLRGHIVVEVPRRVYAGIPRLSVEESIDPETGNVTFCLHLRPRGLSVCIR